MKLTLKMFGQVISSSHGIFGGIGGGGRLNIGGGPPQSHSSSISTQAEDDICNKKIYLKYSILTSYNKAIAMLCSCSELSHKKTKMTRNCCVMF